MSDARQIFTLSQVTSSIKRTLEDRYKQLYWVKAEMHKVNRYPSGHAFPELVQKEGDKILAQMTGTIWAQHFERINKKFIQVVKEPLKEGTTLLLQVKITYSELHGLSLQILDIDPSYSLGELQREREETLKRLQKEGLLNANQQLDFPLLPQRIALISADSSKGYSDFMKVITENSWGYKFFPMLFPAYLQGDVAVASIMDQLQRIQKVLHHFDIVVIVRGGGGEVGMACYNNFELCKAIAAYPIPVLTGIGHSTNLTVAEMVAFRNAITPTELGDFLLQSFHDFSAPVTDATRVIRQESRKLLALRFTEFTNRSKDFKNASRNCLNRSNRDLQNTSLKLKGQTSSMTARNQEMVDASFSVLKMSLKRLSLNEKSALESIRDGLNKQVAKVLDNRFGELDKLQGSVRLLDPVNVLRRGYSITSFQGRSLSAVNLPASGDSVTIRTAEAEIAATVEKVRSTPPDSV